MLHLLIICWYLVISILLPVKLKIIYYNQGHVLLSSSSLNWIMVIHWDSRSKCIFWYFNIYLGERGIELVAKCVEIFFLQLHGRSREQRYTRLADWDYINQCAEAGKPMPVFGKTFTWFILLSSCSKIIPSTVVILHQGYFSLFQNFILNFEKPKL